MDLATAQSIIMGVPAIPPVIAITGTVSTCQGVFCFVYGCQSVHAGPFCCFGVT